MNPQSVSIIVVGDELLDGRSADTNSHWLLRELAAMGAPVDGVEVVGDQLDGIVRALRKAGNRSGTVLVTGGLGPTEDDRTREALAEFVGAPLILDDRVLDVVRERFTQRGRSMPPGNERQATRPRGSVFVHNQVGTAPGILLEQDESLFAALPGVPREMHAMWREEIAERVRDRAGAQRPFTLRLRLARSGESAIAARVEAWRGDTPGLDIAYCVNDWGVDVLLRGLPEMALAVAADHLALELSPRVYNVGDQGLPELLLARLRRLGRSLAVAESCSGGLLAAALTEIPGASDVFRGGVVAYANPIKVEQLGVPEQLLREHGAVSEEVVAQMARGVRERFDADYALSISGIAGPSGGSVQKPVGTIWIAVADAAGTHSELLQLGGDRATNRRASVAAALDLLRLRLGDGRLDA